MVGEQRVVFGVRAPTAREGNGTPFMVYPGKDRQADASVTIRRKRDASAGTGYLFSNWV
jgi:hypothetical protein